ncbi:MAG: hypothetical protein ABSG85_12860, partial [Spirochaetia bacterium]
MLTPAGDSMVYCGTRNHPTPRGIQIRRFALICLLAAVVPLGSLFAESGRPAPGEGFNLSKTLFAELTDNA